MPGHSGAASFIIITGHARLYASKSLSEILTLGWVDTSFYGSNGRRLTEASHVVRWGSITSISQYVRDEENIEIL